MGDGAARLRTSQLGAHLHSKCKQKIQSAGAFAGSLRIHGSFRQYKKDREKIRHFKSSSGDSGINISSEESSSSPTTLPRTQKPDNAPGIGGGGSVKKKSMILKPVEFGQAAAGQAGQQKSSGLTNLQQLIGNFWGVCEKNPSFFFGLSG